MRLVNPPRRIKRYVPLPPAARSPNFQRRLAYLLRAEERNDDREIRKLLEPLPPEEARALRAYAIKRRFESLDEHAYIGHLTEFANEFRRVVATPEHDEPTPDLAAICSLQPHVTEFFRDWFDPTIPRHARPAMEGAKAVAIVMVGLGKQHLKSGHDVLTNSPGLMAAFSDLCDGEFRVPSYEQTTRIAGRVLPLVPYLAMRSSAAMVRELAEVHPGVGRFVTVDGTKVPGWNLQRSDKNRKGESVPGLEERLRGRSDAGFRITKQRVISNRDGLKTVAIESYRGWLFTVVTEMATGLPLVADMRDAAVGVEAHSIHELLPLLHRHSPDLPVEGLVADAGWDHDDAHEYAMRGWGIHLVARRSASHAKSGGVILEGDLYHPTILRIDGSGRAYCRTHNQPMLVYSTAMPVRADLRPGELMPEAKFRTRYFCPLGCGRPSARTYDAWSAMPHLPLNPLGLPKLHAKREALLSQRNAAETVFSSLKAGYGQGLSGSFRTRLLEREKVEGLLWLAMLVRSWMVVAADRAFRN